MNRQPIEKQVLRSDGFLEVHSIFYTIQGEGPFSGHPAVFVRLAGCNLRCPLCDTDYTSDRRLVGPKGLIELVKATHDRVALVVITGGEPFRQNLTPAVRELLDAGYMVQVETNGTLYLAGFPYEEVTVVCSPKSGRLSPQLVAHKGALSALKYVVQAGWIGEDGLPEMVLGKGGEDTGAIARPPRGFNGFIYVQPADEKDPVKNTENLQAAVASSLRNGLILGIQLHKQIGAE